MARGASQQSPLHSERTQGFAADPDYWKGEVFAYVGSIQNLKNPKDHHFTPTRAGRSLFLGTVTEARSRELEER